MQGLPQIGSVNVAEMGQGAMGNIKNPISSRLHVNISTFNLILLLILVHTLSNFHLGSHVCIGTVM